MGISDQELKRLFRAYIATQAGPPTRSCPSFDRIARILDPHTRVRKKLRLIDHVTRCSQCLPKFDFLLGLERYQKEMIAEVRPLIRKEDNRLPLTLPYHFAPALRLSTIIIGLLLLTGSTLIVFRDWERSERTRDSTTVLVLVQPKSAEKLILPAQFKWRGINDAQYYKLALFDQALLLVWESGDIHALHFELPVATIKELRPEESYYWMVTAYLRDGRTLESPIRRFIVLPSEETSIR